MFFVFLEKLNCEYFFWGKMDRENCHTINYNKSNT